MRHAQSAEKQGAQSDKARELTTTGLRQALLIGNYLYQTKNYPDIIITSTALRAQHTATGLLDALKLMPDVLHEDDELYNASVRTFFQRIADLDDAWHHVLMVAHNPAITYLAEYLTKAAIGDMPPAAVAIIQLNIHQWKDLKEGCGELLHYITPENLSHADQT